MNDATHETARFKVVLIEDDQALRESLVEYLASKGHSVVGAPDGDAGLRQVDDQTAVVVTDLKLPGMSGLDVLKRARQQNPRAQVIIATGYATVDSAVAVSRAPLRRSSVPDDVNELARISPSVSPSNAPTSVVAVTNRRERSSA